MSSKAEQLGPTPAFGGERRSRSERARLIEKATGADSVAGEVPTGEASAALAQSTPIIPINKIAHNPFNPRESLHDEDVKATADSLLERGQVTAVTVVTRPAWLEAHPGTEEKIGNAEFVALDGNIRLAAASIAGLEALRADINDSLAASADDIQESSLIANVRHALMDPFDEAKVLEHLVDVYGSARAVGRRVGRSHTWVGQRLELLKLTPEARQLIAAGEATIEDARGAGKKAPTEQKAAVKAAAAKRTASKGSGKGKPVAAAPGEVPPQRTSTEGTGGNGVATQTNVSTPANGTMNGSAQDPAGGGNAVATAPQKATTAGAAADTELAEAEVSAERGNGVATATVLRQFDIADIPRLAAQLHANLDGNQVALLVQLLTKS